MKAKPPSGELFTLPASARGAELCALLCHAAIEAGRVARVRATELSCIHEEQPILVATIQVELGKRLNEGNIARSMNESAKSRTTTPMGRVVIENGREIRTSLPVPTEDVLRRIEATREFWSQFKISTKVP